MQVCPILRASFHVIDFQGIQKPFQIIYLQNFLILLKLLQQELGSDGEILARIPHVHLCPLNAHLRLTY